MKIAVTATGDNLDAAVDPRFGRCAYFIVMDTETGTFEALENAAAGAAGGAGIQAGQRVADAGAEAVLTGNVGPNAFRTLSGLGLKVYTGVTGTVKEAIDQFKAGTMKETATSTVGAHFGMGGGVYERNRSDG